MSCAWAAAAARPAPRSCDRQAGRAHLVDQLRGPGQRRVARRAAPAGVSRSTPTRPRSSWTDCAAQPLHALQHLGAAACRPSVVRRAPSCSTITLTEWATESCMSRAMRARSAATAVASAIALGVQGGRQPAEQLGPVARPAGEQADRPRRPTQQAEEEVLPGLRRRGAPQQDADGGQHLVGRRGPPRAARPTPGCPPSRWTAAARTAGRRSGRPARARSPPGTSGRRRRAAATGDHGREEPGDGDQAQNRERDRSAGPPPSSRNSTCSDDEHHGVPTHGTATVRRNGGHGAPGRGGRRRPAEDRDAADGGGPPHGGHPRGDLSAGRWTEIEPAEGSREPAPIPSFSVSAQPMPERHSLSTVVPSAPPRRARRRGRPRPAGADPPRRRRLAGRRRPVRSGHPHQPDRDRRRPRQLPGVARPRPGLTQLSAVLLHYGNLFLGWGRWPCRCWCAAAAAGCRR